MPGGPAPTGSTSPAEPGTELDAPWPPLTSLNLSFKIPNLLCRESIITTQGQAGAGRAPENQRPLTALPRPVSFPPFKLRGEERRLPPRLCRATATPRPSATLCTGTGPRRCAQTYGLCMRPPGGPARRQSRLPPAQAGRLRPPTGPAGEAPGDPPHRPAPPRVRPAPRRQALVGSGGPLTELPPRRRAAGPNSPRPLSAASRRWRAAPPRCPRTTWWQPLRAAPSRAAPVFPLRRGRACRRGGAGTGPGAPTCVWAFRSGRRRAGPAGPWSGPRGREAGMAPGTRLGRGGDV